MLRTLNILIDYYKFDLSTIFKDYHIILIINSIPKALVI